MDLEQLQDLAEKDLKINDTELDLESLKTPQLHNKYLKFLNKWKLLLTKANTDYYKLKKKNGNIIQVKHLNKYMQRNHLI